VRRPGDASVRSEGHTNAFACEPREISGLDAEGFLQLWTLARARLHAGELVRRHGSGEPAIVLRHTGVREVRHQHDLGPLLPERDELVVDVTVADAVRERVDTGAEERLRVVEREDVRGDT
jgi:hypothetical protein